MMMVAGQEHGEAVEIESDNMLFEEWFLCLMFICQDFQPFELTQTALDS
jgi:hypothetical protein